MHTTLHAQAAAQVKRELSGIALLCSTDAVITRVVFDGLGIAGQSLTGTSLHSIFDAGSIRKGKNFLRRIRKKKGSQRCRLEIVANGQTLLLWFSGSDDAGVLKIVGALTPDGADEISRKYMGAANSGEFRRTISRRELVEKNIELERRSEEKTQWLLEASHDLRNQLYALSSWAEMLGEETVKGKELAAAFSASANHMLRFVSDLAEIAQADSVRSGLSIAPTALLDVIDETISLNRSAAESKATALDLISPLPIPVMQLDAAKIHLVFHNIIHNAIKYSQHGAHVRVCVVTEKDQVLVTVHDNGPGIPADELNSIFAPFQKTRARAACSDPGTGLGLAICKRIVERHGGRIWVESTLGHGAAFTIALPHDAN